MRDIPQLHEVHHHAPADCLHPTAHHCPVYVIQTKNILIHQGNSDYHDHNQLYVTHRMDHT